MQLSFAALALVAVACARPVDAYPRYISIVPNGANVTDVLALGHVDREKGGGELNAFGKAFASAGAIWTTALCKADSDGDGQTNGQELGDPCCSWRETGNLAYIHGVSDPGDPESKVNPLMYEGLTCMKSEDAVDAADRKSKKTKKPKATKPKATTPTDNGSGGATVPKSNTINGATGTAMSTALAVGIVVAWAML